VRAKDSKNFLSCKCMMVLLAHFIFSRWWKTKKKIHKERPQSKVRLLGVGETTPHSPLGAAARNRNRLTLSSLVQQQQPKKKPSQSTSTKPTKTCSQRTRKIAQVQSTQQQHHYHHHDHYDDCRWIKNVQMDVKRSLSSTLLAFVPSRIQAITGLAFRFFLPPGWRRMYN
jgi:hypothetical protein